VEKLRKQLTPPWVGRKIVEVDVLNEKYNPGNAGLISCLTGSYMERIDRLGKNLWIQMGEWAWHIHLSSTGWFLPENEMARSLCEVDRIKDKFIHKINSKGIRVRIHLDDGQIWVYVDPRTWGKWHFRIGLTPRDSEYFKRYGPDWLDEWENAKALVLVHRSRRRVKDVLTDQRVAMGVGNYLSCEVLWRGKIHPHTRWHLIIPETRIFLATIIREMIAESLIRDGHEHWGVFKKKTCMACG